MLDSVVDGIIFFCTIPVDFVKEEMDRSSSTQPAAEERHTKKDSPTVSHRKVLRFLWKYAFVCLVIQILFHFSMEFRQTSVLTQVAISGIFEKKLIFLLSVVQYEYLREKNVFLALVAS